MVLTGDYHLWIQVRPGQDVPSGHKGDSPGEHQRLRLSRQLSWPGQPRPDTRCPDIILPHQGGAGGCLSRRPLAHRRVRRNTLPVLPEQPVRPCIRHLRESSPPNCVHYAFDNAHRTRTSQGRCFEPNSRRLPQKARQRHTAE